MSKGLNEKLLLTILSEAFPNKWVPEFKGIPGRLFRFDAANPTEKIAVEIEGAVWMGRNGGHTSGLGYEKDMTKYNLATLEGWRVLRYSPSTLKKHPEQILLDVHTLTGSKIEKATTKNGIRSHITETKGLQLRLA